MRERVSGSEQRVKAIVQLRDHDGALVGLDTWGAVLDVSYSGVENAVTVSGSDGAGVRLKRYGSGQYAAVFILAAGGDDFSLWPTDAKRVT
jgi:hypothetical protein